MKPKNQRLVLVVAAIVALIAAALLAMWGLRSQASYFYTPADIVAGKASLGKAIRLGGMVAKDSVARDADGVTTRFIVEDGEGRVAVTYRGILPDGILDRRKKGFGIPRYYLKDVGGGVMIQEHILRSLFLTNRKPASERATA